MRFKLITPIITALGFMMATAAANADPVIIGFSAEPYPPFTWKDPSGEWKGFEVELADAICEQQEMDCEIAEISWDGIIPALSGHKIDVIIGSMTITDKRKEVIDFSDPYYSALAAFIGEEGQDYDGSPESVAGKIIGVQVATTYADFAESRYGDVAEIRLYDTQDAANSDLLSGRVDIVIAGRIPVMSWLSSDAAKGYSIVGDVPFDEYEIQRIGAGIRKDDTALKETFNEGLAAILANGTYDEIAARYFDEDMDIYGMPRE